jgi:NAD(P)-dependent dehydrogenase (short-subunit alcohol dehydrogenase family)
MTGRLAGKIAVVFGAGSSGAGWGNGKAVAVLFAREGATVVSVDFNIGAASETAAIIQREGGSAIAL